MIHDRYVHDAVWAIRAGETRVSFASVVLHSRGMRLIATSDSRKNAFISCLPDDRKKDPVQQDRTCFGSCGCRSRSDTARGGPAGALLAGMGVGVIPCHQQARR